MCRFSSRADGIPYVENRRGRYEKVLAVLVTTTILDPFAANSAVVGDLNSDGKIKLAETILFLQVSAGINVQSVTTVISAGQTWMDRNLGASQVAKI